MFFVVWLFLETSVFQPQSSPDGAGPELLADLLLGVEKASIARPSIHGEALRRTIFDNVSALDNEYPFKVAGLADVMGDAEECGVAPQSPCPLQQLPSFRTIEAAKRLIENGKPHG